MIETNIPQLVEDLVVDEQEFLDAVARRFAVAGEDIAASFRDEDLSGRKANDTGLHIRTGRLHDSIKSLVEVDGAEIAAEVYNRGAPYWWYHEVGAGRNPKRLDFLHRFETEGLDLLEGAVDDAFTMVGAV